MSSTLRQLSLTFVLLAGAGGAQSVRAQPPQPGQQGSISLSLADAVQRGERESEAMRVAQAGTSRARGLHMQARSQLFPDVAGSLSYQRAIQSQFEEIGERLGGEDTSSSGGGDLADSPLARIFASPNTFILGLTASQTVYAGGRVRAGIDAADAGRRAAELGTRMARAQVVYRVAEAYFDAQVASQLYSIAESSFVQAERTYRQTELAREVGNVAEYDLIRARVQRENARPAVIVARTQRDVALIRLRQILNLPADRELMLTTPVEDARTAPVTMFRTASGVTASADTAVDSRAVVLQAEANVVAQERQVTIARAERLPGVVLSTNYQRFAYPAEGAVFEESWKYYFPNWTVSLGLSMPLFTGGRIRGQEMVARANLDEARARLDEAREAAVFDARLVLAQLEQAEAVYAASTGTDDQAARAYAIAEVRYSEGISTQLELTQARVDLGTARANRVRAARDVALGRLGIALLEDLPLGVATGLGAGAGGQ
jgi:outer membrane protein TolC